MCRASGTTNLQFRERTVTDPLIDAAIKVRENARNFKCTGVLRLVEAEMFSNRILAREELLSEGLVHDDHPG